MLGLGFLHAPGLLRDDLRGIVFAGVPLRPVFVG